MGSVVYGKGGHRLLALKNFFSKGDDVKAVLDGIEANLSEQLVSGLSGSARPLLLATIYEQTKRPQLVVTNNLYQAQKLYEDLSALVGEDEVFLYSINDLISSEVAVASPEMKGQRIEVLNHWSNRLTGIVITPVAGLRRLLPPKEVWKRSQITFEVGVDIDLSDKLTQLVEAGFERVDMVSAPGQFSLRGGIIDIYPLTEEFPVRIELFDTEIDSIRYFDVDSQRSKEKTGIIKVGPAQEFILFKEHFINGAKELSDRLSSTLMNVKNTKLKESMREQITHEIGKLKQNIYFDEMYKYMSLYYGQSTSLIDYVPSNGLLFVDEISRVQEMDTNLEKEEAEWQTSLLGQGAIVSKLQLSKRFEDIIEKKPFPLIYLSLFLRHVSQTNPKNIINFNCKSVQNFHGQLHLLKSEVERWHKMKYKVVILVADEERAKRVNNILEDYEIQSEVIDKLNHFGNEYCQITSGLLATGFELPMQKLVVLTEEEIFTKKTRKPQRKQKLSNAERIKSYSELKIGDLVVHINHGIGKYLGIKTLEINDIHKDYLHITYAGNDKLFVPVEQIDQIQKYVGSEDKEPKIYALGGNDWKKVKTKVQKSVEDIADDLIKLYAEREATKGYAFSKSGSEQREFESSFPYQETEDQLRCIQEIMEDMEKERPMDRLLCGDVGYGKTEVAIRAAFKAIMDGKQVAFLVPTTILAQQHYETVRERFAGYPINIGILNRFKSKKMQTETIKGLNKGTVDIVIGTHRLLSKDIQYKDLGLLIIDEEQRFGVTHKEKIKQLKTNIDVLTLTATPIPRTLHMSMLGVRDLSVIETPPENRFPIQTYVVEFNESLVREAIERELSRGGQVYFLYNRVDEIAQMAERVSAMVPDAKVSVAHGQMKETELETVMLDFLEGNSDVLVTTTIIETGVDIPNVNTLIVYNADRMGLSQLYQLRGRVGRSNRVAYSYFTYQKDKVLTEVAEKRLQAIKEFTELGSGFKIAMRDLSIRGAGNLLGSQQHGFIDSVGFDFYSQMLKEAIDERKGISKEEQKPINIEVDLKVDAYIPEKFISDSRQKIDMYKRFKIIQTLKDILELQDEMIDRFGNYPEEVEYLFKISKIKVLAKQEKIKSLTETNGQCSIFLTEEESQKMDGLKLFELANKLSRNITIGTDGPKLILKVKRKQLSTTEYLELIEQLLTKLPKAKRK